MKSPTRAIRVPAGVHIQAKIVAIGDGIPLSEFVAAALVRELDRRLSETPTDSPMEQTPHAR